MDKKLVAARHGPMGHTMVMSPEDHQAYECQAQAFLAEYQPKGVAESQLVQFLIDDSWRCNRFAAIKATLHSSAFDARDLKTRDALVNINIHCQRLNRQFERTLCLLRKIQAERRRDEKRRLARAAKILKMPTTQRPC